MAGVVLNADKQKPIRRKLITGATVLVLYTDWRGVTEERFITPIPHSLKWHEGDFHYPQPQWMMEAWDHKLNKICTFAMKDFKKWQVYG